MGCSSTERLDAVDITTLVDLHDKGLAVDFNGIDLGLAGQVGVGDF